jgi:hypothetical protein
MYKKGIARSLLQAEDLTKCKCRSLLPPDTSASLRAFADLSHWVERAAMETAIRVASGTDYRLRKKGRDICLTAELLTFFHLPLLSYWMSLEPPRVTMAVYSLCHIFNFINIYLILLFYISTKYMVHWSKFLSILPPKLPAYLSEFLIRIMKNIYWILCYQTRYSDWTFVMVFSLSTSFKRSLKINYHSFISHTL